MSDDLLARIRQHREEFEAAGDRAEQLRTLPPDTVDTLRGLGLFWLKTPAELGGTPLSPLEFCDVIEELAYIDSSTAWAAMIGAGCGGLAAGWLPEAGARRVFAPGGPLPVLAGQLAPRGTGEPADGGYRVTGRWSFASGIAHSAWIIGAFKPLSGTDQPAAPAGGSGRGPGDGVPPGPIMVFAAPKDHAEVTDNWHVAGLQGTGSLDYRLDGVFVPAEMTYRLGSAAVRGGALFRLGMPAFVSNEVPPFCVGVARRALDEMTALASRTARLPGGAALSERAVFHKELGLAEVKIRAARLVHRDAMAAAWESAGPDSASSGSAPSAAEQIAVTSASVFAVETCAGVVTDLFRYGGGRVLALSSPIQRHLRDLLAARQHLALSEEHYETAGRARIESSKRRD